MERETPVVPVRVELLCPEHLEPMRVVKRYLEFWRYQCPQCKYIKSVSYRKEQYPHIRYKTISPPKSEDVYLPK